MTVFIRENLKSGLEELPVVERVLLPSVPGEPNTYYGMNVSPSPNLEPLDQLDGFLAARYVQNAAGGEFFPFVAGAYEILNVSSCKEVQVLAKSKARADSKKSEMLKAVMESLGLKGSVLTTYELWNDPAYWRLFDEVVETLDSDDLRQRLPGNKSGSILMRDFPAGVLGAYQDCTRNDKILAWPSPMVYVPAEVAEAIWFRDNRRVVFKIGPIASESLYDDFIREFGLGIIGLTQPQYFEGVSFDGEKITGPRMRNAVPYIGKRGQNRVLFSDTIIDLAQFRDTGNNPSYERALALYETFRRVVPYSADCIPPIYGIMRLIGLAKGGNSP